MANSVFDNLTVAEMRAVAKAYGVKLGQNMSKQKLLAHLNDSIIDKPTSEELLEMGIDSNKTVHRGRPPKASAPVTEAIQEKEEPIDESTPISAEETAADAIDSPAPEASEAKPMDLKAHTQGLTFSSAWVNKGNPQNPNGKNNWNRTPQRPLVTPHPSATGADPLRPSVGAPSSFKPRFGPGSNTRAAEDPRRAETPMRNGFGPRRPEKSFLHAPSSVRTEDAEVERSEPSNVRISTGNPLQQSQKPANPIPEQMPDLLQAPNLREAEGVLELHPDGYGFLHSVHTYQAASTDIYVSAAIIHRYNLRMGDYVKGKVRPHRDADRYEALVYLLEINGIATEEALARPRFDELTPCYPTRAIKIGGAHESAAYQEAFLKAPIGFGSRVLLRCTENTERSHALADFANDIRQANPDAEITLLLIDARPEDVTELCDRSDCNVLASSFETSTDLVIRQVELVIERAKRLTESGKDVIIIVDSLSQLITLPSVSNSNVLKAKKLFGSARATREAGTLTVIGLLEALPKELERLSADFSKAANTEIVIQDQFYNIDSSSSYTRRPELLL